MSNCAGKQFIFNWQIENFHVYLPNAGMTLKSPVFVAGTLKETSWYLEICLSNQDKVSCYLCKTKTGEETITIDFTIEIRDGSGEIVKSRYSQIRTFSADHNAWGFDDFYEKDELENQQKFLNEESITVRCVMVLQESIVELASQCSVQTKIGADRSSFRWNVEQIDSPTWKESKIFPCSSKVYFEIMLSAPEDSLKINIKKVVKGNSASHYVSLRLSILDVNGIEQDSKRSKHLFCSNDTWEFPSFLEKKKFLVEKSKYLRNGTFTLLCEFTVSKGKKFECIEDYNNKDIISLNCDNGSNNEKDTNILLQDLKQMYTSHWQTDVNLQVENQTFPAHRAILSARSPVFAAMFGGDMLEKQTGVVHILDVEAKILELFLVFLYTGTVENLDYESSAKLLVVADKYQVPSLKKKCCAFLTHNLSITNICDVVKVADIIGDDDLMAYAVNFIASHKDVILTSDEWSRSVENNIRLATCILHKLSFIGAKNTR